MADQFLLIDYRIFEPERDGKTKLDPVQDMLISAIHRDILFGYVLMDSWYATAELMKLLISKHKIVYCPLKANRKVDDSPDGPATLPGSEPSGLVGARAGRRQVDQDQQLPP